MKKILSILISGIIMLSIAGNTSASTINVTYTASGSVGNYLLDFTLANNIPESYDQKLFFFGVDVGSVATAPNGWSVWNNGQVWNNSISVLSGSNINYTSNWITNFSSSSAVESETSLSNFMVTVATLPTDVHFFAFGHGNSYFENDAFFKGERPGFEGTATTTPVPEPGTMMLLGIGMVGLVVYGRRRMRKEP